MPAQAVTSSASASAPVGGNKVVDPKSLQFFRAIKDTAQAHELCKRLETDNRDRVRKDALIQRKLNGEQPWNAAKLKAAGQSWRHNRSTDFMSSLIRRICPAYKQAIDDSRFLTSAALPLTAPEAQQKSMHFRTEVTRTIRRWRDWHSFTWRLVWENVSFGRCVAAWLDTFDWKPHLVRGDDAFLPDGCPQDADGVEVFVMRHNYMIHELSDKLVNPQLSTDAGWNIDNIIEALNNSQPENRRMRTAADERKYEDLVREFSLGSTYSSSSVKVIETYHLFVREANGLVSHYIVTQRDGKEIFKKEDRFERMSHALALFCVEVGNGKFYGSKGAGRVLYNTHVAVEQARNLIADALFLRGLVWLKGTQRGKDTAAIVVNSPTAVVNEGYEVVDVKFQADVDAFFSLDRHSTQIAELQVGAFNPGQILDSSGEKRTASEVNYVASVETQLRQGTLVRFFGQFLRVIAEIQRRICSPDNVMTAFKLFEKEKGGAKLATKRDIEFFAAIGRNVQGYVEMPDPDTTSDAVLCCLELLRKGLTPEEILALARCSPSQITPDMAGFDPKLVDMIVTRYKGDPSVEQNELKRLDITSKLGLDEAERLIIPQEDNTVMAEAVREQLIELNTMAQGEPIPISPRDAHAVHMSVVMQKAGPAFQSYTPASAASAPLLKAILQHFDAHLSSAVQQGAKKETLSKEIQFAEAAHKLLDQPMTPFGLPKETKDAAPAIDPSANANGPRDMPPTPVVPGPTGTSGMPLSKGPMNMQPPSPA